MVNKSKNPLMDYSDPKKMGTTGVILGVVSLFIFGQGLSLFAIISGVFGLYKAIKLKSGMGAILLNILAIIIGIVSQVLLAVFVKK